MSNYSIHPNTLVGPVSLVVTDLERSLPFYTDVLGFRLLRREGQRVWLGAGRETPLLQLAARSGARPKPARTTGLYHFAVLVPGRPDLARSLRRLLERRYPLQGASDHLVSEALYLADPDGNNIEIYADRPRAAWPRRDGQIQMATDPLDAEGLLGELVGQDAAWTGLPALTRIGHVHLQVADLAEAEAFYRDGLGFELITRYGAGAAFLAAGGYHHHIGLNTWASRGGPPPPADAVGLRYFTILLPGEGALGRLRDQVQDAGLPFAEADGCLSLRDPAGNGVVLAVDAEAALSADPPLPHSTS